MLKNKQKPELFIGCQRNAALYQSVPFFIAAQNVWIDEKGLYYIHWIKTMNSNNAIYEGWNFNSGNYLFTTDTK